MPNEVPVVHLTPAAAARVASFVATRPGALGLRFGVRRTGCSGWAYTVEIAEAIGVDDLVVETAGVRVMVDAASLPLVSGTQIDFARKGLNAEFVFHNPNVTAECGCGESFTIA